MWSKYLGFILLLPCILQPAEAKIITPLTDEELVRCSDLIVLGRQVDAVTIKIDKLLWGPVLESPIELIDLAEYPRQLTAKDGKAGLLDSEKLLIFRNCRTYPCSLVFSGVKRFSRNGHLHVYQELKPRNLGLAVDLAGRTQKEYLAQLTRQTQVHMNEYNRELARRLEEGTKALVYWLGRNTRWGYKKGLDVLLQIATNSESPDYLSAVWALRKIRDPSLVDPLLKYIQDPSKKPSMFDHIRAAGAIGGTSVLPFAVRLTTIDDGKHDRSKVRCGGVHALRLLVPRFPRKSGEFRILEDTLLAQPTGWIWVLEALATVASSRSIEALLSLDQGSAAKYLQQARDNRRTRTQTAEKLRRLKAQAW